MHRVDHYSWHVIKFTIKAFDFVRFVHVPDCNDYRIKVKIKVFPYQHVQFGQSSNWCSRYTIWSLLSRIFTYKAFLIRCCDCICFYFISLLSFLYTSGKLPTVLIPVDATPMSGRVEIFWNYMWGPLRDSEFPNTVAIICNDLGHSWVFQCLG